MPTIPAEPTPTIDPLKAGDTDRRNDDSGGTGHRPRGAVESYVCPKCGRQYHSPVRLGGPPICSGDQRKHSPAAMKAER